MRREQITGQDRREFLRFLAGSPLIALPGFASSILADLYASDRRTIIGDTSQENGFVIKSPDLQYVSRTWA